MSLSKLFIAETVSELHVKVANILKNSDISRLDVEDVYSILSNFREKAMVDLNEANLKLTAGSNAPQRVKSVYKYLNRKVGSKAVYEDYRDCVILHSELGQLMSDGNTIIALDPDKLLPGLDSITLPFTAGYTSQDPFKPNVYGNFPKRGIEWVEESRNVPDSFRLKTDITLAEIKAALVAYKADKKYAQFGNALYNPELFKNIFDITGATAITLHQEKKGTAWNDRAIITCDSSNSVADIMPVRPTKEEALDLINQKLYKRSDFGAILKEAD